MTRETNRERMERRGREPVHCELCGFGPMHPSHLARHMRTHGIDRRQPNIHQLTMFPVIQPDQRQEPTRRKPKPSRATCSHCGSSVITTRFREHLYWSEHTATRWDGRTHLCHGSSATLCTVPDRDGAPCACQEGSDDGG